MGAAQLSVLIGLQACCRSLSPSLMLQAHKQHDEIKDPYLILFMLCSINMFYLGYTSLAVFEEE